MTAAEAVRKFPFAGVSLSAGNGREVLSHETIADHLQGCEAAQLEAFEQALALAAEAASVAFQAQEGWVDGVRAGLQALLEFFDEEPALARYLVVHSAQAGPAVLGRRGEVLDRLALVLDDERAPGRGYPPPLTAEAVVCGVLGVLHGRLAKPNPGVLVELAGPLMSFIVLPFLDVRAARRELSRPLDGSAACKRGVALDVLAGRGGHLSYRTVSVLRVIAAESGLSSKEVTLRAGVRDQGQTSRLLSRLMRLGVVQDARAARGPGGANAWRLTPRGEELEAAVRDEAPAPERRLTFELAQGLDYRTLSVLRVIGDQPGLSNSALARRTGFKDPAALSTVLAPLARLGLIESTRGEGREDAWQLTASGEELDGRVGREIPAWRRSTALDLMRESGGRLSERVISVLRVIGVEPGLSNRALARRVGIRAEIHISRLLARLAERGLIENTRSGGRENVWQQTASGKRLDRAIARETPAPPHGLAVELMRASGARLNQRSVAVLSLLAAAPGLSNGEIALRVGMESSGYASTLLARLARRGLVEVTRITGRKNAWQLTASGRELAAAIHRESPAPKRSVALDPLRDRGGRLNRHLVSVLRVIGSEPGLSNIEIALRVGVTDQSGMSQLLARLARPGLIENTRREGRENLWQLTVSGQELERLIREQTPAPVRRLLASDRRRDGSGRLNRQAVSALMVIASEPGLSNTEIARRLGIEPTGKISKLLARLAGLGLIENTNTASNKNAWQLTARGRELEQAIRDDGALSRTEGDLR